MYTKKDLSIFLIDDSPALIEMLRDFILQKHPDAQLSLYYTGEDALKDTFKNPDIIILDYYLDGVHADAMNGIQVLKKLKEELPETPIIMLSSQG
ncbi:MAG: response regulator [Bacteroidetes bacterium]|nr:response regulator [Bacteroidota bacterium]